MMKLLTRQPTQKFAAALSRRGWRGTRRLSPRPLLRRRFTPATARWNGLRLQWRRLPGVSPASAPFMPLARVVAAQWLTHVHLHASLQNTVFQRGAALRCAAPGTIGGRRPAYSAAMPAAARAGAPVTPQGSFAAASAVTTWRRVGAGAITMTTTAIADVRESASWRATQRPHMDNAVLVASALPVPGLRYRSRGSAEPFGGDAKKAGVAAPTFPGVARPAALNWAHASTLDAKKRWHAGNAQTATRLAPAATRWLPSPPPLVWRKQADVTPAQNPVASGMAHVASGETPQQQARMQPALPSPAAIAGQLRAHQLDPVLAERLATEVIRRVERSLRIERERRGH